MAELPDDVDADLRRFIADNFPLGGEAAAQLDPEQSLVEAGVIDSTGVLELIGYVEETYGLEVPDADLVPENFDSLANVARYVGRRLGR